MTFFTTWNLAKAASICSRLLLRQSGQVRCNSNYPPYSHVGPPPLPPQDQREWEDLIRRVERPAASSIQTEKEVELQLHPDARHPLQPDFEGDTNPKTGEIGGPKKDPLKWGAAGEWTYGGRATDF